MVMFIRELVRILDREREGWRKTTVLTLDGASYHQSDETMDIFKQLKVPMMILGPHSYNCAPCELLFSALKRGNLNPEMKPTGKR